jgi:hypothetical protein
LPRPEYSPPYIVAIAIFAVLAAMYGNVIVHPEYLVVTYSVLRRSESCKCKSAILSEGNSLLEVGEITSGVLRRSAPANAGSLFLQNSRL